MGAYWSADFRGAAHVFARRGSSWEAEQTLVASDGDVGHRFGNAVSLDGDRALIASSRYDSGLGAAYVFAKGDAGWSEEQKLLASDGDTGDLFAWSVAMADGRALVGANYADQLRGKAYAFELGAEPDRPGPNDAPEPEPASDLCSSGNECASGHCEDGLCCDRSCKRERTLPRGAQGGRRGRRVRALERGRARRSVQVRRPMLQRALHR